MEEKVEDSESRDNSLKFCLSNKISEVINNDLMSSKPHSSEKASASCGSEV